TAIMGRMHAPGKGLSQSALPYRRSVPTWLKLTSDDVKEQIFKLAKKGLTPSQIGVILRDSHGVAQVRFVTGNKILRILKSKGLAPDLPEDLYHLIKKAVAVRKHLERNRKDKDAKFRLILVESRIHRLARYYKTKRVLPPNWKYPQAVTPPLLPSPVMMQQLPPLESEAANGGSPCGTESRWQKNSSGRTTGCQNKVTDDCADVTIRHLR
ncbi:40S ribosomal protein S13-like, partial [Scleropages formosus]